MFHKLMYPRQTYLVTAFFNDKANVSSVDWAAPVSIKPPMLAISVSSRGLTADLITRSKEFVIAIPPEGMKEAVLNCAKTSGKFIDKFDEFGIKAEKAEVVSSPLLSDAMGQIECKVSNIVDCGDHTLFVGEVVEIHLPDEEKSDMAPLFNLGSKRYFGFRKEWLEVSKKEEKSEEKKDEKKAEDKKEEKKAEEKKEDKKAEEKREEKKDEKKADEKKAEEKKEEKKTDEKKEEKRIEEKKDEKRE